MDIQKYIIEQALILIPALYVLGIIIKKTNKISDSLIPLLLLCFGIFGSVGLLGINTQAIIQGILVTGVTVLGNQLLKQSGKDE